MFKFWLQIIYQNILMPFNFGVVIYIVGKLLVRQNIGDDRQVCRCLWVVF